MRSRQGFTAVFPIGSKLVLTSARCSLKMLTTYIFAGSPIIDLALVIVPSNNLSQGQMRKGTKTIPHEKFTPKQYEYDVALVLLDEELTYESMKINIYKQTIKIEKIYKFPNKEINKDRICYYFKLIVLIVLSVTD